MKNIKQLIRYFAYVFIILFLTDNNLFSQINCDNDTTFLIPLVDLQSDFYLGHQGGLYPGGVNEMPVDHANAGIAIAQSIQPINYAGDHDTVVGKLVMLGLGPLDAGKSFNRFVSNYNDAGFTDTCFKIINSCIESYGLNNMTSANADDFFWSDVNDKLQEADVKRKQVQIVWMMSTSFKDTLIDFNSYTDSLHERYLEAIKRLKKEFINLKLLYISGLHYGGYLAPEATQSNALTEPAPYYNDFAIKDIIEAQINGDTLLSYADSVAPWIAWGPNFWADGRNQRVYDSLRWICPGDFDTGLDGYTLDGSGQDKVATALLEFFTTEETAAPWIFGLSYPCFPDTTSEEDSVDFPDDEVVWIVQNPVHGVIRFLINLTTNDKAEVVIYNLAGQIITTGSYYKIEPGKSFTINLSDNARGFYILSVLVEGKVYNVPFYLDT